MTDDKALRKAAERGDPQATVNLGSLAYKAGDLELAESWYQQAADLGNADAMHNLGVIARDAGDLELAESWFQKSADLGNSEAMYTLGALADEAGDLVLAKSWYQKAADRGYTDGMWWVLGIIGPKKSGLISESGEPWQQKAAEIGSPEAMARLGWIAYEEGDLALAESWYKKSSDLGSSSGMVGRGRRAYDTGDLVLAESWLRKAADLGNSSGMYGLGVLAEKAGDLVLAESWYQKSADLGNPQGMLGLGRRAYEAGYMVRAEFWLKKVADLDSAAAMFFLAELAEEEGDSESAESWLQKAADLDSLGGLARLGDLAHIEDEIEWDAAITGAAGLGYFDDDEEALLGLGYFDSYPDDKAEEESLEDLDSQWFLTDYDWLDADEIGGASSDIEAAADALATLVIDYRADEHGPGWVTKEKVLRWVNQFGGDEEFQLNIVNELLHVLTHTYFPAPRIEQFYRRAVLNSHLLRARAPAEFWSGVHLISDADQTFLDEKPGKAVWGSSRAVNTKRFQAVLAEALDIEPEIDPEKAHSFMYVDDLICTGGQATKEIKAWMVDYGAHQAPRVDKDMLILVPATHTWSSYAIGKQIRDCAGISEVRVVCEMSLESKYTKRDVADVYWPAAPQGEYERVGSEIEAAFNGVAWRTQPSRGTIGIFSSAEARDALEWALLKQGMELCRPYIENGTRPFGRNKSVGIGLGTPIVTGENCPNHAPLALWMETPNWTPLFPRRPRRPLKRASSQD